MTNEVALRRPAGGLAERGPRRRNATLEDVRLLFRNFGGKEGQYNRAGDRNFNVILPDEMAEDMIKDGWNVKPLKSRDEDEAPAYRLEVAVKFDGPRPPEVTMITQRGRTRLPEDLVDMLDYADIEHVDMIISPYEWSVNGRTGVKAYLHKIFVTIVEDDLELKYADLPEYDLNGNLLPSLFEKEGERRPEGAMDIILTERDGVFQVDD